MSPNPVAILTARTQGLRGAGQTISPTIPETYFGSFKEHVQTKSIKVYGTQEPRYRDQKNPRGSINTPSMELGSQNHSRAGLSGPISIMVVYMDPLG